MWLSHVRPVAHAQMELECLECVGRAVLSPRHKQRKMDYRSACTLSAHTPKHNHTHTRKPPNRRVRNPSRRRKSRLVRVYLSGSFQRANPQIVGLGPTLPPPPPLTGYLRLMSEKTTTGERGWRHMGGGGGDRTVSLGLDVPAISRTRGLRGRGGEGRLLGGQSGISAKKNWADASAFLNVVQSWRLVWGWGWGWGYCFRVVGAATSPAAESGRAVLRIWLAFWGLLGGSASSLLPIAL